MTRFSLLSLHKKSTSTTIPSSPTSSQFEGGNSMLAGQVYLNIANPGVSSSSFATTASSASSSSTSGSTSASKPFPTISKTPAPANPDPNTEKPKQRRIFSLSSNFFRAKRSLSVSHLVVTRTAEAGRCPIPRVVSTDAGCGVKSSTRSAGKGPVARPPMSSSSGSKAASFAALLLRRTSASSRDVVARRVRSDADREWEWERDTDRNAPLPRTRGAFVADSSSPDGYVAIISNTSQGASTRGSIDGRARVRSSSDSKSQDREGKIQAPMLDIVVDDTDPNRDLDVGRPLPTPPIIISAPTPSVERTSPHISSLVSHPQAPVTDAPDVPPNPSVAHSNSTANSDSDFETVRASGGFRSIAETLQRAARHAEGDASLRLNQEEVFRAMAPVVSFLYVLALGVVVPRNPDIGYNLSLKFGSVLGKGISPQPQSVLTGQSGLILLSILGLTALLFTLRVAIWVTGKLAREFCTMDVGEAFRKGTCVDGEGKRFGDADLVMGAWLG